MKNITLKIDEETYRRARIRAAERGTSVSAMVKGFLEQLDESEVSSAPHDRILSTLERLYAESDAVPSGEPLIPLTRDEIYAGRLR
jgi:plasmid stability protein